MSEVSKLTAFQTLFSQKADLAHFFGAISDEELQMYNDNLSSYEEQNPEHQALYEQLHGKMLEGRAQEKKRTQEEKAEFEKQKRDIQAEYDAKVKAINEEYEAKAKKRLACPPALYFKVRDAMREAIALKVIDNYDCKNIRTWIKTYSDESMCHLLVQLQERIQKKRNYQSLKAKLQANANMRAMRSVPAGSPQPAYAA